jgi:hypothetical protein
MHWNHNERCRLISISKVQSTERVQATEKENVVNIDTTISSKKAYIDSTSSKAFIECMLDNMQMNVKMCDNNMFGTFSDFNDGNQTEDDNDSVRNDNENTEQDLALMMKYLSFKDKKEDLVGTPMANYKTYVDLLHILKTCNTPLYMFDKIMAWACKATWVHKFDFLATEISKRDKFIVLLKRQFDYTCLEPTTCEILLPGSKSKVNLVLHDFKECFYSLLSDPQLMDENNLLINPDDIFGMPLEKNKQKNCSDVNTGDVWKLAHTQYVNSKESELLCPIIFLLTKHILTCKVDYV